MRALRFMLALLALAGVPAAAQTSQPCPTLPATMGIEAVTLLIVGTGEDRPYHAALRGTLLKPPEVPDSALRSIGRARLCAAAVGEIMIDGSMLCPVFGETFGGRDTIERTGPRIAFEIHADVPELGTPDLLNLYAFPSTDRCAPRATFVIAAGPNQELAAAPLLADRLSAGRMVWTEAEWGPLSSLSLDIAMRGRGDTADRAEGVAAPALSPPGSWTSYAEGEVFERLGDFLWVPLFALVILGGFMAFGGALLYAKAKPPLAALVKALTAAVALYVAARWASAALDFARLLNNAQAGASDGWTRDLYERVSLGLPYETGRIAAATAFIAPITLLLWIFSRIAGIPRTGASLFRHSLRLTLRSLAVGSFVALLFLLVAAGASLVLPANTPFEPVALVVSAALAWWAVTAFNPVSGFDWRKITVAVLALTFLLLYPQPVIHGGAEPPTAIDNALVWFPFAGGYFVPNAMLLTIALIAALKLAHSANMRLAPREADRTLLFLFGLSVTLTSIGSLTSAVLLFAVLAVGDRLIFSGSAEPRPLAPARGAAIAAKAAKPRQINPGRLALAVAVIAAIIFWLQYSGDLLARRSGPRGLLVPAMLIYTAAVPAAIGGLLLQHSYARIPSPIAATKALVITAFAFAATVATRLTFIAEERSILPAVIDVLGIFTALLAIAILVYDWPEARRELGGATIRERLGGTGFGWLLTILSSISLAAVSALSPILFDELGQVFRTVVRETLGQADADRAQGDQAAPEPPKKAPPAARP
jgi:hypothetical protein